ncbi:MAG: PAS domain S-box protein [Methanomicrobiaceae archaeon]|nr:PAS domain S-box protein [Methanomicrobiaceae archaeon]
MEDEPHPQEISPEPALCPDGDVAGSIADMPRPGEHAPGIRQEDDSSRENEERLNLMLEATNDGLWDRDIQTGRVYLSPRWYTMLGYEPYEMPPSYETWLSLIHEADRYRAETCVREHTEQKRDSYETEFRMQTKSGGWKWILSRGRVVAWDREGRPARIIGTHIDITERRRMEHRLRITELQKRAILDNIPDIAWQKDVQLHYVAVNEPFAHACGRSPPDVEGLTDLDVWPHRLARCYMADDREVMNSGRQKRIVEPLVDRDESLAWMETIKTPIFDSRGTVIGITGISRDITERKRAEDALKKANTRLNLLNGVTRHDIINQLTILLGYLRLDREEVIGPERLRILEKEISAAEMIQHLIGFTRDYQDIGLSSPRWQGVRETVARAAASLDVASVQVVNELDDLEIFADPLLEKVFYNLMDNALRYGVTTGTIRFRAYPADRGMVVACEDDGVGISGAEKKRIFSRGYGKNTGYGLFLIREILAITGLSIRECGIPGEGARFEITVPPGLYRGCKREQDAD